jgi:hypothetical protein
MARTTKTVPVNRFDAAVAAPTERLGRSTLAAGRYLKKDQYGFHLLRVLPDAQEILYTVHASGMVVEKINFVPSSEKRDGNGCFGGRWLNILAYRQGEDHAADFAVLAENGMKMAPDNVGKAPAKASGWTAG